LGTIVSMVRVQFKLTANYKNGNTGKTENKSQALITY
jgi:hypothetical protein